MEQVFPGANIVAGVLVLIVGSGFHFCGQLVSVINWDQAVQWGLQEAGRPEYKVYEQGMAMADVVVGWTYAIAGVGLLIDQSWAYTWAWLPGVILTYHALSYWFWTNNQRKNGDHYTTMAFQVGWGIANLGAGILTLVVAYTRVMP